MTPHAHRLPPCGSVGCATCRHPRESLAELLLAIAILALFVVVFVIPAVSR